MKLSEKIQEALREQQEINLSDPAVQTALRERVMDAIAEALGDAYDCTRNWSAWGYGTMSQDDFSLVADDSDRIGEIADAAIGTIGAHPAPSAPSEEAAAEMGANGGHVVEAERLAFEAWMRGHCWELGAKWTGTEYRSAFEKGGMVDMHAMRTRELWAAWRDRAALAAPKPEAKP